MAQTGNRIQWTLTTQLDVPDFTDHLALLSRSHQLMQEKTEVLADTLSQVGLNIHKGKTKILKVNTTRTSEEAVTLEGTTLEEVEGLTCLGSVINRQGGTNADVRARISKDRA